MVIVVSVGAVVLGWLLCGSQCGAIGGVEHLADVAD